MTVFDLEAAEDLELLDAELLGGFRDVTAMAQAQEGAPAPQPAPEASPLQAALARGERDENRLADVEFFARHPERQGARIQASEKALAKEWLQIRDQLVRPALARAGAAPRGEGAAPPPPPAPGSNAEVAERLARDTRKNQIIAGALGVVALVGIGVAVTTR